MFTLLWCKILILSQGIGQIGMFFFFIEMERAS